MEINVLISAEFKSQLKRSWLKSVAEEILKSQCIIGSVEMGLVITNQEEVQQLNQKYRGINGPTDVLAFSIQEGGADPAKFIEPPNGVRHLGEVIISYPQAFEQAEEHEQPVEKEMAILLIHGVLHLLGYEHDEPPLEREMRAKEAEILSLIEDKVKGF